MDSVSLRKERLGLVEQARSLITRSESEGRELNTEERAQWDAMMADADKLREKIEHIERQECQAKVEAELRESQGRKIHQPYNSEFRVSDRDRNEAMLNFMLQGTPYHRTDYKSQELAVRCGITPSASCVEFRVAADGLNTGTNASGGYTVPTYHSNTLAKKLLWYAPFRNYVNVLPTATASALDFDLVDDTANKAAIIAEAEADSEQHTNTFSRVTLGGYTYTSKIIKASVELLRDSVVDLDSYLSEQIATRFGRAHSEHAAVGTGTDQPRGFVTAASQGVSLYGGALEYADIVNLIHSVDPTVRPRSVFCMHDTFLASIANLHDDNGRPLWLPSLITGEPDRLLGYPVLICNDMDDGTGYSDKPCVFGDLKSYTWRDVGALSISILRERYAEYRQVAYVGTWCNDGDLTNHSGVIKYLTTGLANGSA